MRQYTRVENFAREASDVPAPVATRTPGPPDATLAMAQSISAEVMGLLEREMIPPTPPVYGLLFEHSLGASPVTSAIVDGAVRQSERSGRPLGEALRDATPWDGATDTTLRLAAELAMQLDRLGNSLDSASASASEHREALLATQQALRDSGAGRDALRSVVRTAAAQHDALIRAKGLLRSALSAAQAELAATREQLAQAARDSQLDAVTGLPNRLGAEDELLTTVDEARRGGASLTLILVDIDRFKVLNDSYGHQAGDRLLREVGRALSSSVRAGERVFRFGGDEYVVIVHDSHGAKLEGTAERLRRSVADIDLARCMGDAIVGNVTVSLGLAVFRPADSFTSLFERADTALYRAKHAGRNRWMIAD